MTPETLALFHAVVEADGSAVKRALAAGADVNATDGKGRNVASHAALGDAIDIIDAPIKPCLSESRLEILQLVLEHPDLSLYSLNAPLPWAGGVTLLGLMSWLNMPTEIMFLLEYTQGMVEVNAMDEQGATPLMYAARDGSLEVVQRLLAHGARPDLRDTSQRSAIQYALPHPQILWLCEDALRHERVGESQPCSHADSGSASTRTHSTASLSSSSKKDLFLATSIDTTFKPPPSIHFNTTDLHRTFDALLRATRAGDDVSLDALLFPVQLDPLLINLRDSSGLSLVHHAVSQRRRMDGAVLDVLYRAGADVGLFSTLGFSPLHHLARTARDPTNLGKSDHQEPPDTHALYAFTMHLLRDLRAPLAATDAKGETPLHAAAEHGNSRLVLQAMLDYEHMLSGTESVRQLRNERQLRPVEVCRPEFLSLFTQEPAQACNRLRAQDSWDSTLSKVQVQLPPTNASRTKLSRTGRPQSAGSPRRSERRLLDTGRRLISGHGLLNRTSDGSFGSRSSSSSSASSDARSCQSHPSMQSRKPGTPLHTRALPTPSPTGTSLSDIPDTHSSFDVPAYTHDLLSNLYLCASALQAYSQVQQNSHDRDYGDFPDLPALSDAIVSTRDIGSLVLEHWTRRLDLARAEFERARKVLEKAQDLREKVGREVGLRMQGHPDDGNSTRGQNRGRADQGVDANSMRMRHAAVQTDISAVYVAHLDTVVGLEQEISCRAERLSTYVHMEEKELEEPPTPSRVAELLRLMRERRTEETKLRDAEDEVRITRWYAESASRGEEIGAPLLLGWMKSGSLPPLEIVREIESSDVSMVGREVRKRKSVTTKGTPTENPGPACLMNSCGDTLWSAPRVLQRVDRDLSGIVTQLAQVTQSFIRAQHLVAEASAMVDQALKVHEDGLQALAHIHPQPGSPHPPSSFRLPGIPQESLDSTQVASSARQLSPSASSYGCNIASGLPVEEPHALRRLLTRKIEKYIERVFNELQKAHVWLRIIREVLRGLRRRAASVDHH